MNRLDACTQTRHIAATTLVRALQELLASTQPISEVDLSTLWLAKLRAHKSIYPDGWYMPPPYGTSVLFASDSAPARVSPKSLRPQEFWPRNDVFLDRERGLVMLYASPVDRSTGMIGDFGLTLYFGDNPEIKSLLRTTLEIDQALFGELEVGLEFSHIARRGAQLLSDNGLYSALDSPSDPTGTNIGHTIPASDTGWSQAQQAVLRAGDWDATKDLISGTRRFINASEDSLITSNMAHTLEPRPQVIDRPDLPTVWFHNIVVWRDGHKQLLADFDELFQLAGMGYMHGR